MSATREARYAEAIKSCVIASNEQLRDLVEAVMAVADAEQATLIANQGATPEQSARCPGCGSAMCQWKRLECESPVTRDEHRALGARRYDGWIDCVVCSCDPQNHPTTSIWLEEHWSGEREAGVQVLRDLIAKQSVGRTEPAPEDVCDGRSNTHCDKGRWDA